MSRDPAKQMLAALILTTTAVKVKLVCNFCGHKFSRKPKHLFDVACPKCRESDVDLV